MTTKKTIEEYFHALSQGNGWQAFLADKMTFTSHTSPMKQVTGKDAYVQSTKQFYSMIGGFELRRLIIDGDRACALTRYSLQPPTGDPFACDVAELFSVKNDKIDSLEIYFDSAPFSA